MSGPWGRSGFSKARHLVEAAIAQGCDLKELHIVDGQTGEASRKRYLVNPKTKGWVVISDLRDDEYLSGQSVAAIERRLGMILTSSGILGGN